jgi:hypothetical protein
MHELEEYRMMLLQNPAQTSNYMVAGFTFIFGMMGLYLLSLIVRKNNLERDLDQLETLQADGQ